MSHEKRALRAGTEAHYADARLYDQTYRRRRDDVRFYADLAEEIGGPVLELGVGTGRVARAIAQRGIDVVGVDRMPEMLARARDNLDREPRQVRDRVELRRGDLGRVRLRRSFPLVIAAFNVFMHLYERRDWERALATCHHHLVRDGRLAFDVLVPDPRELVRDPNKTYRVGAVRHPDDGTRYRYGEAFDYEPVTQVQMVTMVFEDESDPTNVFITPLAHRQVFPAELESLLHYNGFDLVARWGDFERGPLDADSESQIVLARIATRRARL